MRSVGGGRKLAALFWLMLPRGCGCAGGSFRQLVVRVLGPKRPRSARGTIPKLFIQGATPEDAARHAEVFYYNTHPAFEWMRPKR
jgi:hypothetical protein